MKLRALLVLLVLAACDDAEQVAGPPPREPGRGDVGNYCGMVLVEHPGPKAQIFLASRAEPVVVHPGARRHRVHPPARGAARHHRHLGQRHGPHDQLAGSARPAPGPTRAAPGSSSQSSRAGGMGAPEAVPFGTEPPARAFAAAHGGRVVRLDEIPDDYVLGWTAAGQRRRRSRISTRSRPARHERPVRPTAAADRRLRRRACPAGRRRPGDARDHVALAGLRARRRIRRSCWLIPTARQPSRRSLACRAEIARLERIFSLYRTDSALSLLNRQGRLDGPTARAGRAAGLRQHGSPQRPDGAFDVTVQPLWDLYAEHFADPAADPAGPSEAALAATLARVDWRAVELDPAGSAFAGPAWR